MSTGAPSNRSSGIAVNPRREAHTALSMTDRPPDAFAIKPDRSNQANARNDDGLVFSDRVSKLPRTYVTFERR